MSPRHAQTPQELGFSLPPRVMQMLGRENVSSSIIALLELVKNAYDADARTVTVTFRKASTADGFILVEDDGEGMSLTDIKAKWMRISTDNKLLKNRTRKLKRIKVGEKGIGRLSLDRLSSNTELITHRAQHPGVRLSVDWTKYESTKGDLSDVKHPYYEVLPSIKGKSGTTIYITNLRDRWTKDDYEVLYTDLALLIPPFGNEKDDSFSVIFDCDEAPELSGSIQSSMIQAAEYKLVSRITAAGRVMHTLKHRSGRIKRFDRPWSEAFPSQNENTPACGPVKLTLFFFVREKETLRELGVRSIILKQFLDKFQGVRIYRDNIRVKPYGDPLTSEDWLGLNLRRVRRPGGIASAKGGRWVVAGNQVVGNVFITRKGNPSLTDQTNREGLAYNKAYLDLRRLVLHGIQFLESERIRVARASSADQPTRAKVNNAMESMRDEALASAQELHTAADNVAASFFGEKPSQAVSDAAIKMEGFAEEISKAQETISELQTENQLMIGLASLGITMAAFGHETAQSITDVLNQATFIGKVIHDLPNTGLRSNAEKRLERLIKAAERVESWGKFALDRIRSDKRNRKNIDLNQTVETVLDAFKGSFERRNINLQTKFTPNLPSLRAFSMDIEAIIINFITNSVEALKPVDKRTIHVETSYEDESQQFIIVFADNGRGIHKQDLPKIFDPMFTTRLSPNGEPEGTGLGLTIVNNIVNEYGGTITANGHGILGGAEFLVSIPRRYSLG